MRYELFYLVGESKAPEIEKIKESVRKIGDNEGIIWEDQEISEKRKMAYKINGHYRGIYVARRFDLPKEKNGRDNSEIIHNISRQIRLNQDILRFLIVNTKDLPELESKKIGAEKEKVSVSTEKKTQKSPSITSAESRLTKKIKNIDEELERILKI